MKSNSQKFLTLVSAALLCMAPAGSADTLIWNAAVGDWFTPANWTPPGPPTATDDAQINNAGTAQVAAAGATAQNVFLGFNGSDSGTLQVSGAGTFSDPFANLQIGHNGTGTLNISTGGTVSNSFGSLGALEGSTGTATVDGAGSTWTNSNFLTVGGFGTGTLQITNGGSVSGGAAIASSEGSTGLATVDGAGSQWTTSGNMEVGQGGNGTLNITAGGAVSNLAGKIANFTGSTGAVTVDGAGSTWTNSSNLTVASNGIGTLAITNGGAVSSDFSTIGQEAGSTGTATVDGAGSTWTDSGDITVGLFGDGTLNITNGGAVSNTDGFLGGDPSLIGVGTGVGTVTVDGAGSTWSNSGELGVGVNGLGTLNITNGGAVSNTFALIGRSEGSDGSSVTVDGAGSTWTNSDFLIIATFGNATLNVTNGGAVSTGGPGDIVGYLSTGTANIDGAGSTWTNSASLSIGQNTTGGDIGTLNVTNGGTVSNTFANIGVFTGAIGIVNVDGAGSMWTNNGFITVANFGTATMNITNGGVVSSTDGFIAGNPNDFGPAEESVGTVNVDGVGSSWTNSGLLSVGEFGTGTLNITNGGAVSNVNGFVGRVEGSTGMATVDGPGSTWTNNGDLYVGGDTAGAGGDGLLQILNSASVSANTTTIWAPGTVLVNATLNSPSVLVNGGLLAGNGSVVGNVSNSGFVSPGPSLLGPSPGTLTISPNYTQNSDGTLTSELGGLADGIESDLLQIFAGNAIIDGTVQLIRINNFMPSPGDEVTILTATGGRTGEFATVERINWSLIQPTPQYDRPNEIYVTFDLSDTFLSQALTRNQECIGELLDDAALSSETGAVNLITFLGNLPLADLPFAFELISPDELTSIYTIAFSHAIVQNTNLLRRMDDIRAGSNGLCEPVVEVVAQNSAGGKGAGGGKVGLTEEKSAPEPVAPAPENRWGVFATGTYQWVDIGGDSNSESYELDTGGFTAGVDYLFGRNFAVGLHGGYARSNANLVDHGHVEVDGVKGGLYATFFGNGFFGGKFHVDGAVGGGFNDYDTRRTGLSETDPLGESVHGDTEGSEFNAMVAWGHDWRFGCLNIGTISTLQYTNVYLDGFTEEDSFASLRFPDQDEDSFRSTLGLRAEWDLRAGRAIIRPELRASWLHQHGDRAQSIRFGFDEDIVGSDQHFCSVFGPRIGRDAALVGGGLAVQFSRHVSLYAYYDGVFGRTNYEAHAASGGIRIGF